MGFYTVAIPISDAIQYMKLAEIYRAIDEWSHGALAEQEL
jgi:hypothetical protein